MNINSILLIIGSILLFALLIYIFIKVGLTSWPAILVLIAIALILIGLSYLSIITNFFKDWENFKILINKIIPTNSELIF